MLEILYNELDLNTQLIQRSINQEATRVINILENDRAQINNIHQLRQSFFEKLNNILQLKNNIIAQYLRYNQNACINEIRQAVRQYESFYIKNELISDVEVRNKFPIGFLFIHDHEFTFNQHDSTYFK